MGQHKGKRRSKSQRIGKIGEKLFEVWATERHLTTQKIEEDVGIDFFCQIMKTIAVGVEEATGSILAVQTRSVEGRRKRVKLSREDAENILRTEAPFCLIGVDTESSTIHFRFLDEDFVRQLHSFLMSDNKSISFKVDDLEKDSKKIITELNQVSRPSLQHRLLMLKAELNIVAVIPGGKLFIRQGTGGDFAIVSAPWLTSAFEVSSDKQSEIAKVFFEEGKLPAIETEGFKMRSEIKKLFDMVDGKVLLSGEMEKTGILTVKFNSESEISRVKIRHIGDESACITESGCVLVFSETRKVNDQHVHEMKLSFTKEEVSDLSSSRIRKFLSLLHAESKLYIDNDPWLDISYWPNLGEIGKAMQGIETVFSYLGKDFDGIYLKDVIEEEPINSIAFLEALIKNEHSGHIIPGFVLGPSAEAHIQDTDSRWHNGKYRIPVVANLLNDGLVVWIEGDCKVFVVDGLISGFKPLTIQAWDVQARPQRFEKSKEPEAWVHKDWPSIPIISAMSDKSMTFSGGIKHEFGGEIWILEEEQ
jgi:hypothetical protein